MLNEQKKCLQMPIPIQDGCRRATVHVVAVEQRADSAEPLVPIGHRW